MWNWAFNSGFANDIAFQNLYYKEIQSGKESIKDRGGFIWNSILGKLHIGLCFWLKKYFHGSMSTNSLSISDISVLRLVKQRALIIANKIFVTPLSRSLFSCDRIFCQQNIKLRCDIKQKQEINGFFF